MLTFVGTYKELLRFLRVLYLVEGADKPLSEFLSEMGIGGVVH